MPPPTVALRQPCTAMIGLRRGSPPGGPLLFPLVLLAWQGLAYRPVVGLRYVGCRVRGLSNVASTYTPWGVATPYRKRRSGQRQRSKESSSSTTTTTTTTATTTMGMRIRGSAPSFTATIRGSCSHTRRSSIGSSTTATTTTGVFLAHNNNGNDRNGSGENSRTSPGFSAEEFVCDQCGDSYCSNDNNPRPPAPVDPTEQPPQSRAPSPLSICRASGCGVAFLQCQSCETEYAGCCSVACQTLAATQVGPSAGAAGVSSERDPRDGQVTPSVDVSVGSVDALNGVSSSGDASGKEVRLQDGDADTWGRSAPVAPLPLAVSTPLPQATPSSPSGGLQQVPDRSDGCQIAKMEAAKASKSQRGDTKAGGGGGDGGGGGAGVADGGGKAKRKREQPADEPLLENYASRHSEPESASLASIREATISAQPGGAHMVSGHLQGELLKLLTKLSGAKRVLDIGTFTGYSALAFAEALPEDGVVITLESDARAAETARGHFSSSEHGEKIRLVHGQAMDAIDQMIAEEDSLPFDIIFVDADKKKYWDYLDKVLSGPRPALAPAGMLLADNVLFHELVPLAEATGSAAVATAPREDASIMAAEGNPRAPDVEVSGNVPSTGTGKGKAAAMALVGGGVLPPTPRRMKIAESLDAFNKRVREDKRVEVLMLPLRDGLSVVRWRDGGYPAGGDS